MYVIGEYIIKILVFFKIDDHEKDNDCGHRRPEITILHVLIYL